MIIVSLLPGTYRQYDYYYHGTTYKITPFNQHVHTSLGLIRTRYFLSIHCTHISKFVSVICNYFRIIPETETKSLICMKTMGKSGLGRKKSAGKKICTLRWTETRQPGTETGFVWGQFQPDPVYHKFDTISHRF